MLTIYINSEEEMAHWKNQVENSSPLVRQAFYLRDDQHQRSISFYRKPNQGEAFNDVLIDDLYAFFTAYYLEKKVKQIVRKRFLYEDEIEINQITDIAMLMWEREIPCHGKSSLPEQLRHAVHHVLSEMVKQQATFSFQSLWKFRLRECHSQLIELVGTAIDEYKMEQDYQEFIFVLRNFLSDRNPAVQEIHLVYDEEFLFFDEYLHPISKQTLVKSIDRKLMAENPIYIDSNTIAPLVSLAPHILHLYTDDGENGIVLTLKQIFEERIRIYKSEEFHLRTPSET